MNIIELTKRIKFKDIRMKQVRYEELKDVCARLEKEEQRRKIKSVGMWLKQYKLAKTENKQRCIARSE